MLNKMEICKRIKMNNITTASHSSIFFSSINTSIVSSMKKNYEILLENRRKYCLVNIIEDFRYIEFNDLLTDFNENKFYKYLNSFIDKVIKNDSTKVFNFDNDFLMKLRKSRDNYNRIYVREIVNNKLDHKILALDLENLYVTEETYNKINRRKYKTLIEEL